MKKANISKMVGISIMTAIVVLLQSLGSVLKLGAVSTASLVMIPIVVGAAVYGPGAGAFLGCAFGVVVLLDPGTALFYQWSVFGTVLTVLVKGSAAGFVAGLIYELLAKRNEWLGVIAAAVLCPIVNTLIYSAGCRLFFWDGITQEMAKDPASNNILLFFFTAFIGINFIIEFAFSLVCAPITLRILKATKRIH